MKKHLIYFLLIAQFLILMGGCGFDIDNPLGDKGLMGQKKGEEIMGYLKTGNSEALIDMFCKVLKDQSDFDEKIEEIMNFIDGEIISYTMGGGAGGRGSTWERLAPNVYNIETDKGRFYKIYISIYIRNENLNKLGIHSLKICLESNNREEFIDEVELYTE